MEIEICAVCNAQCARYFPDVRFVNKVTNAILIPMWTLGLLIWTAYGLGVIRTFYYSYFKHFPMGDVFDCCNYMFSKQIIYYSVWCDKCNHKHSFQFRQTKTCSIKNTPFKLCFESGFRTFVILWSIPYTVNNLRAHLNSWSKSI